MKKCFIYSATLISVLFFVLGCTQEMAKNQPSVSGSVSNLRALSASELVEDFEQQVSLFKMYYGPYNYKQNRFGMNIDTIAKDLTAKIAQAKSEEEALGYFYQFGAMMRDGHVQIRHSLSSTWISKYTLPFAVTSVEGKAIVALVKSAQLKDTNIAVGDELISLDGVTPDVFLSSILKYRAWATDSSNKHLIVLMTSRPSYATEIKPKKETALAVFKNIYGDIYQVEIPWTVEKYVSKDRDFYRPGTQFLVGGIEDFNSSLQGSLFEMGNPKPFFATERVKSKYKWVEVYASDSARANAGLAPNEKPPVYASLYRFGGKTILLVRSFSYSPNDYSADVYLKYFKAIMKEYEPVVDVLVMDQTHNPGGNGWYCTNLASMLLTNQNNAPVQMCRADRKWIEEIMSEVTDADSSENPNSTRLSIAMAHSIEKSYDEGRELSEALPIFTGSTKLSPYGGYNWKKPKLVLIDELAGSCGDVFPMILRDNNAAKFFGQGTMGLGGNVEEVGILNHSRVHVSLTRGLFMTFKDSNTYDPADYIENNGVQPDFPYTHTIQDFRSGFVEYVQKFSEKALEQIVQ